jgi:hypothetical protein
MAAQRHAVFLLVLCAVLWSTGGLLIKAICTAGCDGVTRGERATGKP